MRFLFLHLFNTIRTNHILKSTQRVVQRVPSAYLFYALARTYSTRWRVLILRAGAYLFYALARTYSTRWRVLILRAGAYLFYALARTYSTRQRVLYFFSISLLTPIEELVSGYKSHFSAYLFLNCHKLVTFVPMYLFIRT